MPSGIYRLTFSNGDFYIGKSISISNRWKQHYDKFQKGKAATNMQKAYDKYGPPKGEILFKCHTDHIDIAEELFIHRLKPPLNGTYPKDPFQGMSIGEVHSISELLSMSTIDHIQLIKSNNANKSRLLAQLDYKDTRITELSNTILQLTNIRSKEELEYDVNNIINTLSTEITTLRNSIKRLQIPWWRRLFK